MALSISHMSNLYCCVWRPKSHCSVNTCAHNIMWISYERFEYVRLISRLFCLRFKKYVCMIIFQNTFLINLLSQRLVVWCGWAKKKYIYIYIHMHPNISHITNEHTTNTYVSYTTRTATKHYETYAGASKITRNHIRRTRVKIKLIEYATNRNVNEIGTYTHTFWNIWWLLAKSQIINQII